MSEGDMIEKRVKEARRAREGRPAGGEAVLTNGALWANIVS